MFDGLRWMGRLGNGVSMTNGGLMAHLEGGTPEAAHLRERRDRHEQSQRSTHLCNPEKCVGHWDADDSASAWSRKHRNNCSLLRCFGRTVSERGQRDLKIGRRAMTQARQWWGLVRSIRMSQVQASESSMSTQQTLIRRFRLHRLCMGSR
jgi:hypothetical protein